MRMLSIVAALAAAVATTAVAQNVPATKLGGKTVAKRVASLSKLNWHKDFKVLRARAAESNKLVFWLHVVGELDAGL